ncbi:MAG: hypothetical protein BAJALOKI3v1_70091 [Promethearchaeota archaeon]|nr:MAG: hypothetical protein BAJALOKI3v1_70091 [Candidatus Lokiarchaeota archaeon]
MSIPKPVQYIILLGPSYTPLISFVGIAMMCNFLFDILPVVSFLILHISEYLSTRKFP